MSVGRLLPLASHGAAENMAIDEAVSLAVASESQPPTLRLYTWEQPTLSLGYFQSFAGAESYLRASSIDREAVAIVRRSTGGGAILHHRELTYSLSLPMPNSNPGPREHVYQSVHQSIRKVLARLGVPSAPYRELSPIEATTQSEGLGHSGSGPFLCFQRRTAEDLVCSGYKILGSAQRRVRGAVLQHGSLLLGVSPFADVLPGVQELTHRALDPEVLAYELSQRIGEVLGIQWNLDPLTPQERGETQRISDERFGSPHWTERR